MERRRHVFSALLVATFAGAFVDCAVRIALFLFFSGHAAAFLNDLFLFVIFAVLPVLPAVIISPCIGALADARPKANLIRWVKAIEAAVAVLGALFVLGEQVLAASGVVLLLGITTALFTPLKFAILPEILPARELSHANGQIIAAKYLAYLAAVVAVVIMNAHQLDTLLLLSTLSAAVAITGLIASFCVHSDVRGSGDPLLDSLSAKRLLRSARELAANRQVLLAAVSFAYFLIIGAVFQLNTTLYFSATHTLLTVLLCSLAFGITVGSLCAGVVSRGRIEIGLVPVGTLGVALILLLVPFLLTTPLFLAAGFFIAGVCGGAAVVPLYAFFQNQSPPERRGVYQGIANAIAQGGMLLAALLLLGAVKTVHATTSSLFVFAGAATVLVGAYTLTLMPIALVRCLNWIFTNTVYRIRSYGMENLPESGGAILVCNHISYLDPLLVSAVVTRSVRFLIRRDLFDHPVLGLVLRTIRAIPVSPHDRPRALRAALDTAREAIERGYLVCVFGEGEPSRIGHMLPFSRGIEYIMRGSDAPLIPVYIDQTWGSLFDHREGRYRIKIPKEVPYPASVTFGKPLPPQSKAYQVRQVVTELGVAAFTNRKREHRLLHLGFLTESKAHPFRVIMAESSGKHVNGLKALVGSFLFCDYLKKKLAPVDEHVGVYLPPCIGSALANAALLMCGRIPVNLNYTAGREASAYALLHAGIRNVISSRLFLSKVPPLENVNYIYAEDIVASITKGERIKKLLMVLLLPTFILRRMIEAPKHVEGALATIVFSSGTTGTPKGVMLTHDNISSNVESIYSVIGVRKSDVLAGVLPFFHSFGVTTCLWLALLGGVRVRYHVSPLDAEAIGQLIAREKCTILLATPSFLINYTRKIPGELFKTLRWIVVGAEKLRAHVAAACADKFGIVPLEGYGCTELSPVAMINVPDLKEPTRRQIGNKPGTVGHPIPGVAVKVVHPETHEPLNPGEMGLLLVKGPNVMKGYLNEPEKTAEVIWDGWYVTGDLASLDEAGFVTIHDRLSRFSKIAGEMVPHGAIEDAIQRLLGETDSVCAVTSIADERRGERLVVLHTRPLDARAITQALAEKGFPNLWIPKPADFYPIEAIPMLGSGKLDLQGIKRLAAASASNAGQERMTQAAGSY